jgi:hypothetical protein
MRFVRDQPVQEIEKLYLKAERMAASYACRGYWRAATRWADVARALYETIAELGWQPDEDRADA